MAGKTAAQSVLYEGRDLSSRSEETCCRGLQYEFLAGDGGRSGLLLEFILKTA